MWMKKKKQTEIKNEEIPGEEEKGRTEEVYKLEVRMERIPKEKGTEDIGLGEDAEA